jgi:hypothetical protein
LEAVKEAMNAPPVLRFSEHDRQDKDALSMWVFDHKAHQSFVQI